MSEPPPRIHEPAHSPTVPSPRLHEPALSPTVPSPLEDSRDTTCKPPISPAEYNRLVKELAIM
eukprot:6271538-Pyramimonas_sp.AAC.1